jgi:hypothetical protein
LFFHVMPHGFMKLAVKLLPLFGRDPHKFGTNGDIDIAAIAEVDFPTHARINIRSVLKKKEQAGACHASQGGGLMGGNLVGFFMRLFSGNEDFMQAFPPVEAGQKIVKDLFT